ncbi:MAG: hypothetical protein JWO86_4945 [Myxococcaceae bacterium]|nr:hypothetical protein [Myxococcaceae bacterium]
MNASTAFDFSFTPSRGPSRAEAARLGREAVSITNAGSYVTPSGRSVDVRELVASAVAASRDCLPDAVVAAPAARGVGTARSTGISVVNGTSLASARAIAARGVTPLVLNFASAKSPGGGFLDGALAQEESLARSSALYACLQKSAMYAHHRASGDCIYTDWMIHSPAVPVFRDDDSGALLEEPYLASFLTSPAPNAGVVLAREPHRRDEVASAMKARVSRALAICANEGHRHLVLGAWGCGVFANDPTIVARAFGDELDGAYAGAFDEVVFAVLDWSEERRFIRPFVERFAS